MSCFYWLRSRTSYRAARKRALQRPTAPCFRPRLEALEDRTLPSSYFAATTSDLIADINAANKAGGANTITLTAPTTSPYVLTTVDNTTNGANGLPVISGGGKKTAADNLTIIGNGDTIERSTVSGTPAFRLFDVAGGGSLTLKNLTLQGGLAFGSGAAADGGAIYNQGTLTLSGATVQNNVAQGSNGANGAVVNQKKATGAIDGQPGANAEGGGVWSSGLVKLQGDTLFQNNQAIGGQGGDAGRNGSTLGRGGFGGAGMGGGLYEAGGSVSATSTVNANNATFDGNMARGGAGASNLEGGSVTSGVGGIGSGGGLYVASGTLELSAVLVEHNLAEGGAGGSARTYSYGIAAPGGAGSGGGICIASAQKATLSSVDLMSNIVEGGTGGYSNGGGAYGGKAYGGGLYVGGGAVTLTNGTMTGNNAIGGPGGEGNFPTTPHDGGAAGAGIYIASGAKVSLDSFTVQNTISNIDYQDGLSREDDINGSYILV